jgi:hypothetical protein
MLYWMCKKSKSGKLTWQQMKHAIMRNFGGWESDKVNPFDEFKKRLNMDESELDPGDYDKEVCCYEAAVVYTCSLIPQVPPTYSVLTLKSGVARSHPCD